MPADCCVKSLRTESGSCNQAADCSRSLLHEGNGEGHGGQSSPDSDYLARTRHGFGPVSGAGSQAGYPALTVRRHAYAKIGFLDCFKAAAGSAVFVWDLFLEQSQVTVPRPVVCSTQQLAVCGHMLEASDDCPICWEVLGSQGGVSTLACGKRVPQDQCVAFPHRTSPCILS